MAQVQIIKSLQKYFYDDRIYCISAQTRDGNYNVSFLQIRNASEVN